MRKMIDNYLYDTQKAKLKADWEEWQDWEYSRGWCRYRVYLSTNGRWFLRETFTRKNGWLERMMGLDKPTPWDDNLQALTLSDVQRLLLKHNRKFGAGIPEPEDA